jgi:hypothetical protein
MAQQAAITAAAAAQQSEFFREQRHKADMRETAESIKVQMRQDYLKLVRENKNKMVDLGNGEVKLDSADIELYWSEYRDWRFSEIENQRGTLHTYRDKLNQQLGTATGNIVKTMMGPNIGIAVTAFIVMLLSFSKASNGSQIGPALIMFVFLFGGSLGWTIIRQGMPASQSAWLPPLLTALPLGVLGLALGVSSILGVFLSGVLIFAAKRIRAAFVRRNPEFVKLSNQIASVESQIDELPSQELMGAIRRLG